MTGTLLIVIVSAVHPLTSAVLAVVGDGRSGDPLHGYVNVNIKPYLNIRLYE